MVKAFAILQSFQIDEEWATSAELSRRAGLPESSGYRLIQTLEDLGAIARDRRGRYRPSLLLAALSKQLTLAEVFREASLGLMEALSTELSATVHVGVMEEGMVTYVAKASSPDVQTPTLVGSQLESYCSALGKILLAALPPAEFEAFLAEGDFVALTHRTIIEPEVLRREVEDARLSNYALDREEVCAGLSCVAVPIRDTCGRTVAALSSSDNADRVTPTRIEHTRNVLTRHANLIGAKLHPGIVDRAQIGPGRADVREHHVAR